MHFRRDVFLHDLLSFDFANAALTTLWVSIAAMLFGLAAGLALALMRQSRFRLARWLAWTYLWLFRGTPVLLQMIFAFNALSSFGVILSGPVCAVLALCLHEAAYMAEIFRSGMTRAPSACRNGASCTLWFCPRRCVASCRRSAISSSAC
jgi:polar amino acid transport system permease protein